MYWWNINFNAAVTAFKSGFTEHLDVAVIILALVIFLCNLGVQYIVGSFTVMSMTSRLSLVFRNDVFSDTILSTGSVDLHMWSLCY